MLDFVFLLQSLGAEMHVEEKKDKVKVQLHEGGKLTLERFGVSRDRALFRRMSL
jgi:hypothetical protein